MARFGAIQHPNHPPRPLEESELPYQRKGSSCQSPSDAAPLDLGSQTIRQPRLSRCPRIRLHYPESRL
jgi:hypothetical protein